MLRIKIQNQKDRDNMVVALANAGYGVRVTEEKNPPWGYTYDHYVELLDFEGKEKIKSDLIDKIMSK